MPWTLTLILLVVVAIAAFTDIKTRRIPNWLVLSGLVLGIALNWFLFGWSGLKSSLLGMAVGFGIYFVFYLLHAMSAGDVKLMAAIGSLVGPQYWLAIFFFTAIGGGIIAVVLLLAKGRFRRTVFNIGIAVQELRRFRAPYLEHEELDVRSGKALRLPHGVAIALGSICFVFIQYLQFR
jgi:prepilin peptidase CpaA